jgi:nucleoid-associated protein EbfC
MSEQQPDLSALLEQAQAMQEQLIAARAEVAEQIVEGKAAGGQVTVTVTGELEFKSVHIAPELLDDVEMLEDLILAALHDANAQVNALNQQAVGGMFG